MHRVLRPRQRRHLLPHPRRIAPVCPVAQHPAHRRLDRLGRPPLRPDGHPAPSAATRAALSGWSPISGIVTIGTPAASAPATVRQLKRYDPELLEAMGYQPGFTVLPRRWVVKPGALWAVSRGWGGTGG
jgi:hypothetical protein